MTNWNDEVAFIEALLPHLSMSRACPCGGWADSGPGENRVQWNYAEHITDHVLQTITSWDFLMALLDRHYPEDIFPTMEDRTDRDPGPRIVSLIRHLDESRKGLA